MTGFHTMYHSIQRLLLTGEKSLETHFDNRPAHLARAALRFAVALYGAEETFR